MDGNASNERRIKTQLCSSAFSVMHHAVICNPGPHTDGEGWGIARLKYVAITLLLSRHAVQGINDGILILRSLPQGYFLL